MKENVKEFVLNVAKVPACLSGPVESDAKANKSPPAAKERPHLVLLVRLI